MKQSDIVKLLRKEFGKDNVTVLNAGNNKKGIPDCIIQYSGAAFFVEIKIDSDKLSKHQENFIIKNWKTSYVLRYVSKQDKFILSYLDNGIYLEKKEFETIGNACIDLKNCMECLKT